MTEDRITDLYFESHITIEPVFGDRLVEAAGIGKQYGFRVADLLMQKEREATPERSNKDTFLTGHSIGLMAIRERTSGCVTALKDAGFTVWRYKVEETIVDSKFGKDDWKLGVS